MAPPKKLRPIPLDDPPTASSSSDDDLPPPSKKPEDEVVDEEEEEDSSEEGEEENDQAEDEEDEDEEGSSSEEEEEQVQPTPPPQPASKNPRPESGSESESGAESGSESGSESESEQEPTPPNAKVKPLASKPMKAVQPPVQSTPVQARSGTKRPNENEPKRANKKTTVSENEVDGDGDVKMTVEDSKKSSQRVFNEEDEIAILKGLAEFISKTGKDPMKAPDTFHNFVKKSIHGDANSGQLKRKVRGLKAKFKVDGSYTKEHDKKAFELWKKVWGNNGVDNGPNEAEDSGKVNEKTPKSTKKEAPIRNNGSSKKEVVAIAKKGTGKDVVAIAKKGTGKDEVVAIANKGTGKDEVVAIANKGTGKDESDVDKSLGLGLSEMYSFGEAAGLSTFNKEAMRRGMELIEESKVDEFNEKWRKVQIAEMEVHVARGQLIRDQISIALAAYKKSNN